LANPDDGYCKSLTSKSDCELLQSQMNSRESKCTWEENPMLNNGGECNFNQSSFSWTVVMFVTLFSAVVSAPIALFLDYVIFNILAAKCKDGKIKTEDRIITKRIIKVINRHRIEPDSMIIFHQFKALSDQILLHRPNLSRLELLDFDSKFFSKYILSCFLLNPIK
jgi:hypothetical protein